MKFRGQHVPVDEGGHAAADLLHVGREVEIDHV
jgi:hypothetical protein